MASTKNANAVQGIEMGLQYRKPADQGGALVVEYIGEAPIELRVKADELNLRRNDAEAVAVYRHVIYEDWNPIQHVRTEPHPTIRGQIVYKVS